MIGRVWGVNGNHLSSLASSVALLQACAITSDNSNWVRGGNTNVQNSNGDDGDREDDDDDDDDVDDDDDDNKGEAIKTTSPITPTQVKALKMPIKFLFFQEQRC